MNEYQTCRICGEPYPRTYEEHTGLGRHRDAVARATGRLPAEEPDALRNPNPGVKIVTEACAVCEMPIREEDEPVPVYPDPFSIYPSGYIHGAFDCTDVERCVERRPTPSPGSGVQYCRLPEGHGGQPLWGEEEKA